MSPTPFQKGTKVRALLAGSILALATIHSIPAHADGLPVLLETSVDTGWSRSDKTITARYDRALSSSTTATLVDKNGTSIAVDTRRSLNDYRFLTITADDPDCVLGGKQPYTLTITATSFGDEPATLTTVRTFRVDTVRPIPPALIGAGNLLPAIVMSGEKLKVEAASQDPIGSPPVFESKFTSGIARMEIQVFNPAVDRWSHLAQYRQVVTFVCGIYCAASATASVELDLPIGLWTVKVVAIDLAGNVSGESHAFLVLKL